MTAFCVFASSMPVAIERAKKRVSLIDPHTKERRTESEWLAVVKEVAPSIFAKMKPVQVSPAFDAPQFAEEWIELARATGDYDGYAIKCRGISRDKTGAPKISKTSGLEITAWVNYEPGKQS